MFTVARKWVMGEMDVPLFHTFFRDYKENYVQSMIGGIIYIATFRDYIVDFRVYLVQIGIVAARFIFIHCFYCAAGRISIQFFLHGRTLSYENVPIAEKCGAAYDRPTIPFAFDGNYVWICCLYQL